MKVWQRKIITENLSCLIADTECNTPLLIHFEETDILTGPEVTELNRLGDKSPSQQVEKFYRFIVQRCSAFEVLLKGLEKTKQTEALEILTAAIPNGLNQSRAVIGRGTNGTIVYEETWNEKTVAVKQAFNDINGKSSESEISILRSCKNEFIIQYFESEIFDQYSLIYLELCETTLKDWVATNSIKISPIAVLKQLTQGLEYLHENKIVHRDLHPDNILMKCQPVIVKIADFDRSRRIEDGMEYVPTSEICGSRGWVAPEILGNLLQENPCDAEFTYASDVFALGCIYYFVLTEGSNLFGDPLRRPVNIVEDNPMFDYESVVHGCSQHLLFIKFMVANSPHIRPSCSSLLSCPIFWDIGQCMKFVINCTDLGIEMIDEKSDSNAPAPCKYDHSAEHAYLRSIKRRSSGTNGCFIPLAYIEKQKCGGKLEKYFNSSGGFDLKFLSKANITERTSKDVEINDQNNEECGKIASNIETVLEGCGRTYVEKMSLKFLSCNSMKDIIEAHSLAKEHTKLHYKSWISKNVGFSKTSLKPLKKLVKKEYIKFLEEFLKRKNYEAEMNGISKLNVLRNYHSCMTKHFENVKIFQSKILRTLHDRASQSELAKCIKEARNNHLKEFQLRNLEHAFEKSFEKYINLNYKNVNGTVNSEVWIGIDLGRTYCSVAIFCRGKVTVLRNSDGRSTTPTYLTLDEKEHPIIGTLAKNRALENPENVVHQGMSIFLENDKNLQSQDDKYRLKPFYENNDELIQLCEKKYTQKEIVAFMIQSLIAQVEKTFGFNVKHVVVATPACISPLKMNAIKSACKMANVESSTIDKPTAVALAYMEKTWCDDMRRILIFDFGGKSLDISIVDIEGENIVLQSTESNTHLGGQFLDDVLLKYCIKKFKDGYKIDPTEDKGFNQTKEYLRLQNSCEDAKIELSLKLSAHIQVNDFHDGKDLLVSVTREQFENEIVSHCESCKDLLDKTLEVKHFKKDDIDDIVLVGGSVYIPKVQKLVAEYFSQQTLCIKMHPDESVAIGAAVKAALLRGAEVMESGSFGAIQEETPISIGIEVYKFGSIGHFEKIIPKKSKIPITQKLVCQTIRNNQEDVVIRVYEGEASMTRYNNLIGELILKGVPPKPAGKELIDIIIEINATDVLHIKALCRNKEIQEELLINVRMPGTESRRVSFNAVDSEDASLNLPTVCHQTAFDKKDPVPQLTNTAEELIQNEVENYVIFMKTKAEELLTFEELETLHLNKSQILLENFKLFNPFPKDSDHYEKLNDTLQHQLTQVFYTISREEIGKSKKCKEKLVKFSELYGYKMNAAKEEDSFYEREELRKIHQSCSHEIMSSFLEEFGDETSEECIKQLERAINVQFVLIDFVNEGGSTLSFSETHVWIKECQAEYKERVKLAQYYKQEEELQKIHTEVLPIVINSFQSKWSTKSRKMCDPEPFIKLLHESIQEAYLQLLTVFSSHKGSLEGKAIKEEKEIPST